MPEYSVDALMALDTSRPDDDYHRFPVEAGETVKLMHAVGHVHLDFGPGWVALKWKKGTPMPPEVRQLGLMRGVLNENMYGAGI